MSNQILSVICSVRHLLTMIVLCDADALPFPFGFDH